MPVHESVTDQERTTYQYPAGRDSRSRSRSASRPEMVATGPYRPGIHDWHGTFSGQCNFREVGRSSGNSELSYRRDYYRYGDVGARGNGRGTSGCRLFWTVRGDVCAPVGRFCDPLHLLVVPGICYRQGGGRSFHLLQVLVAGCALVDVDRCVFPRAAVCQYHQHQEFWHLGILVRHDQGRYHHRVPDIGGSAPIWRGISPYWRRELHRTWRIFSEWLEWRGTRRDHGHLQLSGSGNRRRDGGRACHATGGSAARLAAHTFISGALLSRRTRDCAGHRSLDGTGTG